jgi:hypothetical protein
MTFPERHSQQIGVLKSLTALIHALADLARSARRTEIPRSRRQARYWVPLV